MDAMKIAGASVPWLTGIFGVMVALDHLHGRPGFQLLAVALAVVQAGVLARRHQHPEVVAAAAIAAGLGYHLLIPSVVVPAGAWFGLWALAVARPPRYSLIGLAGTFAVCAAGFTGAPAGDVWFVLVVSVCVWALAEASRGRRVAFEQQAQRAVREEQARIARELHDVIAHSVTVMVVQAAAAGDAFDRSPVAARAAVASIEEVGRGAMAELRRLLDAVRPAEGPDAPAPQPGLERVRELALPLEAAGLEVAIEVEGEPVALPAGVDVSAYRIVQEALTNTVRHANASRAAVTIRYRDDAVEVEVLDNGRPSGVRKGEPGGYGVIGMRERAALLGGELDARPTAHGGFLVRARLPLEASVAGSPRWTT